MLNNLKYFLSIFAILSAINAFGQVQDRRSQLDVYGGVKEISVSPDEKIWLTSAGGYTYYTNSIDSNWHYGDTLHRPENDYDFDAPQLERISFFNRDTAIMTGYIATDTGGMKQSGYYLTMDAGQTWKLLDFGGDDWIYDACVNSKGYAWMGGSSGDIFYSSDYGQHWGKLNSPYNSSSRMHSIYMQSTTEGISCSLYNDIYLTDDNWTSYKKIETPFDQKKYTNKNTSSDNRVEKVLVWNDFIVVNQKGHIFYTKSDKIDWKAFPKKIIDFEIDDKSNTLLAVTDSLEVIEFYSPAKFQLFTEKRLSDYPSAITVVNHSLYVLSRFTNVYKVSKKGLTHREAYTTDKKIADPYVAKKGKILIWGISWERHLYIAEDDEKDWYREAVLNFRVVDITLLSDSVAILWDGYGNNYMYSLKKHKYEKYYPQTPLKNFLASPIQSFIISFESNGCFHSIEDAIEYKKVDNVTFRSELINKNDYQDNETSKFRNKVSGQQLLNILTTINTAPSEVPLIKSFKITEEDKKAYIALVDKRLKEDEADYHYWNKKVDKHFYYSIPTRLDSLDDSIIKAVLDQSDGVVSTTSNTFIVRLINQNNDTVVFEKWYYVSSSPWNLPWHVKSNGVNYNCYNLEFSRFINSCIPDDFRDKSYFDNSVLIMKVADYLWTKEDED